jgi:hypothetical protein
MRSIAVVGITLWVVAMIVGFWWLAEYGTTPGLAGQPPESWPDGSALARDRQRWTLVMFLHPHCPCSPASLEELAILQAEYANRLQTHLVMIKPEAVADGWERSAVLDKALSLRGAEVLCDENDEERGRFGAQTSGQIVLYDPHGRLRYSGGITPARGKTGQSKGRQAIVALLQSQAPARCEGAVFGCPLVGRETR